MSTRARIGILEEDGTVTSIYSHSDGYPSFVGRILRDSYSSREKVRALLALGDISQLGNEIGESHPFDSHSADGHGGEWVLAYGRDRGESDIGAENHSADSWPDSGQEYEYLFDPEPLAIPWKVRTSWPSAGAWVDIDTAIREES